MTGAPNNRKYGGESQYGSLSMVRVEQFLALFTALFEFGRRSVCAAALGSFGALIQPPKKIRVREEIVGVLGQRFLKFRARRLEFRPLG